jgi:hypothetical protein
LKEPKATKCSKNCTISFTAHAGKIVVRILPRLNGNLRTQLKISLDLEEEKVPGCNWDAENNIRTNFQARRKTVFSL